MASQLSKSAQTLLEHGASRQTDGDPSPEEIVELASSVTVGNRFEIWEAVDALVAADAPIFDALEERVCALELEPGQGFSSLSGSTITLLAAYLDLCAELGRPPAEESDSKVAGFVERYSQTWSSNERGAHLDRLRGALAVIPDERLESAFLEAESINWPLVGACPTPKVVQRVIEDLAKIENLYYRWDLAGDLAALGPAAVDAFHEALVDDDYGAREKLAEALALMGAVEAAPALVDALKIRSKGVREKAIEGLRDLPPDTVLELLPDVLVGRLKYMRMAAARLLSQLAPGQRRYELARARLEDERTKDVREILESIEPPAEEGAVDATAVRARLSAGADWREVAADTGPGFVRILADHLADESLHVQQTRLVEAVDFFDAHPDALAGAVWMVAHREYFASRALNALAEHLDGLGEPLADMIGAGRIDNFSQNGALAWLVAREPRAGRDAYLTLLGDRRKKVRSLAVEGIGKIGAEMAPSVWQVLLDDASKADAREASAQALEALAEPAALPHLEEALDGERSGRVREAIESAIVACSNAELSVGDFADSSEGDAQLDAALSAAEAERPALGDAELPDLRWATGASLSQGATDWLLEQLVREGRDTHSEQLAAVCRRLDSEDAYTLCDALLEVAPSAERGWGLYVQALIGADRHLEALGEELDRLAASNSTNWGKDAIETLVRSDSNTAVHWLDRWSRKTRKRALKRRARRALAQMAETRGLPVEDLVALAAPDFGFDLSGQQVLDYGPRQLIARLDRDNGVVFIDEKGAIKERLPRARKADDSSKVAAIRERFRDAKRRIKTIIRAQTRRCEHAMAAGRTWSADAWRARFLEHPLTFPISVALVFEYCVDDAWTAFAVADEGAPIDLEGDDVVLPDAVRVRVLHPVSLDADGRRAWSEHLYQRGAPQPFEQLERGVYDDLQAPDSPNDLLGSLAPLDPAELMGRLGRLGFEDGPRVDGPLIRSAHKELGDLRVELWHSGYAPEMLREIEEVEISDLRISRDGEPVGLNELARRELSEVLRDFEALK